MKQLFFLTLLLFPVIVQGKDPTDAEKLFALKVKPLFAEKCFACHGDDPEKIKGDLDMTSLEAIKKGGETFGKEVLISGKGAQSFLYITAMREEEDFEMPPKESEKLSEEQAGWIRDWINGGAPWLVNDLVADISEKYGEGVMVKTSGGLGDDWTNRKYKAEDVWAYQRVVRPDLTGLSEGTNPVDWFIDERLKQAELASSPRADALTLIRRMTFDLCGLPPTPEEVLVFRDAFKENPDKATNELIERLLDSPRYGEQWGRHWLDVARYADSSGFANDYERPNTWRYRDYVIRAFNDDKPYDEFIREQIAGDEIGKGDTEKLIATGFLRMGPWEHTSMSVAKLTRQLFLDDITNSVGETFLAHSLQCARCHDHKFDPIPTQDYYSMQANFATTQFADIEAEWLATENINGMEEDRKYHEQRLVAAKAIMAGVSKRKRENDLKWFQEKDLPYKTVEEAKKAGLKKEQLPPTDNFKDPKDFGLQRIGRIWKNRFEWELDRYHPFVFSVYDGKTKNSKSNQGRIAMPGDPMKEGVLQKSAILQGGDVYSPREEVNPGVLSAVPGGLEFKVPKTVSGRRTALANWIADPDNSLTARVMVNRIWQHHFGKAIAGNPNNFGVSGKKPTHPELLDWLASEFVSNGWSIKHIHRVLMKSNVYQRSGRYSTVADLEEKDPNRDLYAAFQPRRLDAEEIRDSSLAVSGELNLEMGGIPIRPDMNLEAALQPRKIMGSFAPAYVPNIRPEQRNRRTIYAHKTRGQRDPFLEVFNQPGSEISCERRDASNVTPQVFTQLNSDESRDRSIAFAVRLLEAGRSDEEALRLAFNLAFGRDPDAGELSSSLAHWKSQEKREEQIQPQSRDYPVEIVREANNERTGKPFFFSEKLFAYKDYIPDLEASEVDAKTRALADICLALFNANEFVYIY